MQANAKYWVYFRLVEVQGLMNISDSNSTVNHDVHEKTFCKVHWHSKMEFNRLELIQHTRLKRQTAGIEMRREILYSDPCYKTA